jgi:hypothetical protein
MHKYLLLENLLKTLFKRLHLLSREYDLDSKRIGFQYMASKIIFLFTEEPDEERFKQLKRL